MKNFSFLALVAMVLCLVSCGPKETTSPLAGTSDYVLFSKSDVPDKVGIKKANGVTIAPNVYSQITYAGQHFIGQLDGKYLLLTQDNKLAFQSTGAITYNEKNKSFESKDGDKTALYFPDTEGKIIGTFESYSLDANDNIQVQEKGKYGVYTKSGKLLIPISQEMLLIDKGNYIALNSKNDKRPMLKDGKITNWSRVKITAFDKDGKETKAPSLAQVKKLVK